jgi:hypothetical protein
MEARYFSTMLVLGERQDGLRVCHALRERLLDVDVATRLEGQPGQLCVRAGRRADVDHVGSLLLEERLRSGIAADPGRNPAHGASSGLGGVCHGDQFHGVTALDGPGVMLGVPPRANQRDPEQTRRGETYVIRHGSYLVEKVRLVRQGEGPVRALSMPSPCPPCSRPRQWELWRRRNTNAANFTIATERIAWRIKIRQAPDLHPRGVT